MSLDIDFSYVVVLILFLVPLLVLNSIVFRPFMKLFDARHERLEGALDRAEKMIAEAEKKAAAFEEKVKIATARGIEARNSIRAQAAGEMSARLEKERQTLQSKIEVALKELERARATAMAEVQVSADGMARSAAEKLLGRSLS